uniref:Gamma-tubulin complex component n=3 Tax=Rhizophora mucronata TaxID=61149 RepID=A0A2P2M756_RHIMU
MRAQTETHFSFGDGILYATPISTSLRTTEVGLIRGVLQMIQGFSGSLFYWDHAEQSFCVVGSGVYVTHLSRTSLSNLLHQFLYAATCLKLVEGLVSRVEKSGTCVPTLRAFASLVSQWLKRLRDIALKEEMKMCNSNLGVTPTLLGLSSSMSSLCSGAEFLLQIVNEAIPQAYLEPNSSVLAAEIAVHILDYLYKKLDEVCLVQGGEEEAYQMVLHMLVGSLLPYIEGLDIWLFQGTLDDPFDEMFFYANKTISTERSEFWEQSYQLRQAQHSKSDVDHSALTSASPSKNNKKEVGERDSVSLSGSMKALKGKDKNNAELLVCPLFIKDIANSIVAAGKSLQLIRHVPVSFSGVSAKSRANQTPGSGCFDSDCDLSNWRQRVAGLTLSEIFCISVAGLIGHADRVSRFFLQDDVSTYKYAPHLVSDRIWKNVGNGNSENLSPRAFPEKIWYKFLVHVLSKKKVFGLEPAHDSGIKILDEEEKHMTADIAQEFPVHKSFCAESPVITVSRTLLDKHSNSWKALNLSRNFCLPPLNDEVLREAVFGAESGPFSSVRGTNYAFGFQFGKSEYHCSQNDAKLLEVVFPFPTLLPSFEDDVHMSELLPFHENSTLTSKFLSWIQSAEPRITPLPMVIMQECLLAYMKKQVDSIGRVVLLKLMNDWRLMDELAVLRLIYLLGSGDLLQHFLTVLFSKLDNGETLDDDFELNTILQESIRNSADGMLLSASDSLVVSITKNHGVDSDDLPKTPTFASTPHKIRQHAFGIDGLASLKFTYKVSWPLELIANTEAIKKYNQVMGFLLKVKHAKYVLDKARRWMWKGRGSATNSHKHHWLLEQKLLHFVDAFHQYVMDRVYHSAWSELCQGMAAAGALDEVIEVHEAYLLSIQRQCFVVPDKLWALIASRINSILGLALDFYSVQQTLGSGGATAAMKARCEMEVDRIWKQFDDCVAFLLRVLSFKLNVGNFPHLADLVTRINYNYFYMSDSGNLMTATGSEAVASRPRKVFGARVDR